MSQTQFRTLLTEYLGASLPDVPVRPKPKQLTIEGEVDQHICDQVTLHETTTTETTPKHHRTFMVEVIEVSEDSSDEEAKDLVPTLPNVVDLILNDTSTTPSPVPTMGATTPTNNLSTNEGVGTPRQSPGPDSVWTIAQLLQWARSQQIIVTGWESEGLSPLDNCKNA